MSNRKSPILKKVIAFSIVVIFALSMLYSAVPDLFAGKDNTQTQQAATDEKANVQQNENLPVTQSEKSNNDDNYMTNSYADNIDIYVTYMNPETGDKDNLSFEIILETHSVDLSKYEDISKYVELQTNAGVVVKNGFEWSLENSEAHHIGGILKIENKIEGKPIVGPDTKSFKLVFKNIGNSGDRVHSYELDK